MGQALYRKYRPRSLDEVAGQEHIAKTLKQALKSQQISHAYLFTGPRGVGKTSVARIFAHEINSIEYSDDTSHIDIIEIDAASNRRIDEIRELREKVYMAPVEAKYKVYIIDEVHMLTREAFNALLKTLEEPPAHVIFILATTDVHKLPETIISRTQRYGFKPISNKETVSYLNSIAKKEKITVDPAALELIAKHSQGSLRDSESLLDQARSHSDKVNEDTITQLLGLPPVNELEELISLTLLGSNSSKLITKLNDLEEQGYQASAIAKQLSTKIRQMLIDNDKKITRRNSLDLLAQLIEVPASYNPDRLLEITLLRAQPTENPEETVEVVKSLEKSPEKQEKIEAIKEPLKDKSKDVKTVETAKSNLEINQDLWGEILNALKKQHNTLYGVVRMAQPDFSNKGELSLAFAFEFHKKRLSEANNKKVLSDVIHNLTGQSIIIDCTLDKNATPLTVETKAPEPKDESADVKTISNIFNGAEVLES